MLLKALVCYALSVCISVIAIWLLIKYLGKIKIRYSIAHSLLGTAGFVIMLVLMFLLMTFAFSESNNDYMAALMPEWVFKTTVAVLFFSAVSITRYFIINGVYFSRYKEDNGISFLVGYGLTPIFAVCLYCFAMFVSVIIKSLQSGFIGISEDSAMMFGNNGMLTVFTPFSGHVFITVAFTAFSILMLAVSLFMYKHSKDAHSPKNTFAVFVILMLCEAISISVLLFASKSGMLVIAIVFFVLAVISVSAVKFLYKADKQLSYNKQFD